MQLGADIGRPPWTSQQVWRRLALCPQRPSLRIAELDLLATDSVANSVSCDTTMQAAGRSRTQCSLAQEHHKETANQTTTSLTVQPELGMKAHTCTDGDKLFCVYVYVRVLSLAGEN